jgi:hypothetical protein
MSRCTTGINKTGGKFSPLVSTKLAANLPLVSTTPVANLPPVSMTPAVHLSPVSSAVNLPPVSLTPVANNGNNIRLLTHECELEEKNLSIC